MSASPPHRVYAVRTTLAGSDGAASVSASEGAKTVAGISTGSYYVATARTPGVATPTFRSQLPWTGNEGVTIQRTPPAPGVFAPTPRTGTPGSPLLVDVTSPRARPADLFAHGLSHDSSAENLKRHFGPQRGLGEMSPSRMPERPQVDGHTAHGRRARVVPPSELRHTSILAEELPDTASYDTSKRHYPKAEPARNPMELGAERTSRKGMPYPYDTGQYSELQSPRLAPEQISAGMHSCIQPDDEEPAGAESRSPSRQRSPSLVAQFRDREQGSRGVHGCLDNHAVTEEQLPTPRATGRKRSPGLHAHLADTPNDGYRPAGKHSTIQEGFSIEEGMNMDTKEDSVRKALLTQQKGHRADSRNRALPPWEQRHETPRGRASPREVPGNRSSSQNPPYAIDAPQVRDAQDAPPRLLNGSMEVPAVVPKAVSPPPYGTLSDLPRIEDQSSPRPQARMVTGMNRIIGNTEGQMMLEFGKELGKERLLEIAGGASSSSEKPQAITVGGEGKPARRDQRSPALEGPKDSVSRLSTSGRGSPSIRNGSRGRRSSLKLPAHSASQGGERLARTPRKQLPGSGSMDSGGTAADRGAPRLTTTGSLQVGVGGRIAAVRRHPTPSKVGSLTLPHRPAWDPLVGNEDSIQQIFEKHMTALNSEIDELQVRNRHFDSLMQKLMSEKTHLSVSDKPSEKPEKSTKEPSRPSSRRSSTASKGMGGSHSLPIGTAMPSTSPPPPRSSAARRDIHSAATIPEQEDSG